MTENDAGEYRCLRNTTLDSVSATAKLTVVGKFSFAGAQFLSLIKQTQKLLKSLSLPGLPREVNLTINSHSIIAFQLFRVNCRRVLLRRAEAESVSYRVSTMNI